MDRVADEIATKDRDTDDKILLNAIESADLSQASKLLRGNHSFSQEVLDKALISACHHGLKYVVQTLIGLGANVEFKDTQGNTPLMISAGNGFIDIVHSLLRKKVDVNVFNSAGDTALILSIRPSGSSEMVKVLLAQKEIYIKHQNRDGYTALMKAIEVMDIDKMKLIMDECTKNKHLSLIFHVTSLTIDETVNSKGQTAENVANNCRLGKIYYLLEEYTKTKVSPLVLAVQKCDTRSVNTLLNCEFLYNPEDKRDINGSFKEIFIKTRSTFSESEIGTIKRLLECGADINATWLSNSRQQSFALPYNSSYMNGRDTCAINIAAEIGQCELVELLIKYKAEINPINYSDSPLEHALCHGHTDCAKLLIQYGAELNFELAISSAVHLQVPEYMNFLYDNYKQEMINCLAANYRNRSKLLISAVQGENLEIIGRLLDAGADVNQANYSGQTPIVESKNGEVARFLIQRGTNVNQITESDEYGRVTPLSLIIEDRNRETSSVIEVAKVLLENGACVNGINEDSSLLILAAFRRGNVAMLELLLDHGADINQQDKCGNTALIKAVLIGCPKNVACLLQSATDKNRYLNVQNRDGLSALMYAISYDNHQMVKDLIDHGADVNIKDVDGNNALLFALTNDISTNRSILATLISAGIDVNCQNNKGFSPLMLAAKKTLTDIINILLDSGADLNAVSKFDKKKTALSFLTNEQHFGRGTIACIHALLKRGASSSYVDPAFLHKLILQGETDLIRQLLQCGLGPADVKTLNTMWSKNFNIGSFFTVSPLFVALLVGNVSLARYFVGNLFLTNSDVASLMRNKSSLQILELRRQKKCAEFLAEMSSQPLSLFKLAFVTVLSAVGTSLEREKKVSMLPLPQMMKDKLLFKSEVVTLSSPPRKTTLHTANMYMSSLVYEFLAPRWPSDDDYISD